MNTKTHWEHIYETKVPTQVSWYQEHAQYSLQFIQNTGVQKTDHIIDIGGGAASTLVDDMLAAGFQHISVLDVSGAAPQVARQRLGARADNVSWIEADITQANLPHQAYDVWHSRGVPLPNPSRRPQALRQYCAAGSPQRWTRHCRHLCPQWTRSLQWAGGGTL